MPLSPSQIEAFLRDGHLTVADVFAPQDMDLAAAELEAWSEEFRRGLSREQQAWFLEGAGSDGAPLRKLDQPVARRPLLARLARNQRLTEIVEQLIGPGVSIVFSQVFLKPSERGGPKPAHQDNYYFGPDDPHALLTAWIAVDKATTDNGCLCYGKGSHRRGVLPHQSPPGEPYNLQLAETPQEMAPAPVPRGGVSFHHGSTIHQSSANRSSKPRRAIALHYLRHDARLTSPALDYDMSLSVQITEPPRD